MRSHIYSFTIYILLFITFGCQQKTNRTEQILVSEDTIAQPRELNTSKGNIAEYITEENEDILGSILLSDNLSSQMLNDTLIAMQVFDENNPNPYIKYGYEFSGHCYSCSISDILITSDSISLINACITDGTSDVNSIYTIVENSANSLILNMNNGIGLHFRKISNAPIFKLQVKGKIEKNEYEFPEFAFYYTTSTALHKFTISDCGEFDG